MNIVQQHHGILSAIAVIVDRSGGNRPDFGCPFFSLIEMKMKRLCADDLSEDLKKIPAVKPGSE